jgi:16S rRNA (cytosine967-C5)-methyltransferase
VNLRAITAKVIYKVLVDERSLSEALPEVLTSCRDARDQAMVKHMSFGVCRRFFYLDSMLQRLLDKPMRDNDQDIYCLLLVGLYQLNDMRVPPHAAVAETVDAVDVFNKSWAKGLVNAVLRNYQRHEEDLKLNLSKVAYYEHPAWMMEKFKKDWPHDWKAIISANNEHPPFSLRVNVSHVSRENYLAILAENNIIAHAIPETLSGITLEQPMNVIDVPGFAQGDVSVQDGAAQLAVSLLQLEPGQRVLDACAAPGGKMAHILELQPTIELIAVDRDVKRIKSIHETMQRLSLSAKVICSDAANINEWWDGQLFDRILLDAPCSASGVIRRHPDIKLLRCEEDVENLAPIQKLLIDTMWSLMKPGGLLVYVTCSVFVEENTQVLSTFLEEHPDATEEKIQWKFGQECSVGRQILPGTLGMDGFYYGCLRKS